MFTPIYLLPQFNQMDITKYRDRWDEDLSPNGIRQRVLTKIQNGAGENFLQWDLMRGDLGFLETDRDLRGIPMWGMDIDFPRGEDHFKGTDFSYAKLSFSKFKNAVFFSVNFSLATIEDCEFVGCTFVSTRFHGATLKGCRFICCKLIEHTNMTNCDFIAVKFEGCFFAANVFFDCRFDRETVIDHPLAELSEMPGRTFRLEKSNLAEIFKGIKESYTSGTVVERADRYFFKERQSLTRYNTKGKLGRVWEYLSEFATGYGIQPLRVLMTTAVTLAVFSLLFISQVGFPQGLLMSAGAFFTFGANTQHLSNLCPLFPFIYVFESFVGISLMALFVTVLANKWFGKR